MEWMTNPEIWIALVTLTVLELVLGIDNIIFISILAGKLPKEQQGRARVVGLGLAMFTRILMLISLAWLVHLNEPLFTVLGRGISGRDLILLAGGLFLLAKSTHEIHDKLEGEEEETNVRARPTFGAVIAQIIVLDIVFSIDSVITAVGMVEEVRVMVAAVVLAVIMMMIFSAPISAGLSGTRHGTTVCCTIYRICKSCMKHPKTQRWTPPDLRIMPGSGKRISKVPISRSGAT